MTIESQLKLAKHIFRLLKVNEIAFPICRTNKGNLTIVFNEKKEDFDLFLDSVPLSVKNSLEDENNIELKKMIEKYWFDNKMPQMPQKFYSPLVKESGDFMGMKSIEDLSEIVDNGTTIVTITEEPIKGINSTLLETPKEYVDDVLNVPKSKRGRPAGSKNKK